jgi:hypothetical protein
MKKTFAALCVSGALAFASGAFAQTASSSNPDEKDMSKGMTLTGCLREATGTTGEYELTNVSEKSATGEKSTAGTFRLVPGASVSLKEHVGHKVEITGMKEASTAEKAPTTAAGQDKIKVSALKHISPTCDTGTTR